MKKLKKILAPWQKRLGIFEPITVLIVGMIVGVIFWGGFNTAMEATNTMEFCISCHEMRDNVYEEYTETVHFKNASGVQVSCSVGTQACPQGARHQ